MKMKTACVKRISFVFAFLFAFSVIPQSAFSQTEAEKAPTLSELLDITGNGVVDARDAEAALLIALGEASGRDAIRSALEGSLIGEESLSVFAYDGKIISDEDGNYKSEKLSVRLEKVTLTLQERPVACYVAYVLVRDIACVKTALAKDTFGKSAPVVDMAAEKNAVIAISGDYCTRQKRGIVIRNGELYRDSIDKTRDVLAMYADGTLRVFPRKTYSRALVVNSEPLHCWCFGPSLLNEDGSRIKSFDSGINGRNPRCAIGWYGPGEYVLVLVDGRQRKYSYGMTLAQLSEFMESLGCVGAYNLDGGNTAVMANANGIINNRGEAERGCSDIIYFAEPEA